MAQASNKVDVTLSGSHQMSYIHCSLFDSSSIGSKYWKEKKNVSAAVKRLRGFYPEQC